MAINEQEMRDLLQLSRLSIDKESQIEFNEDLTNILGLLDKLQEANTEGVEPLANPHDDRLFLRKDEVSEDNQRDLFIKNAPETEAGLYLVPQVVDN